MKTILTLIILAIIGLSYFTYDNYFKIQAHSKSMGKYSVLEARYNEIIEILSATQNGAYIEEPVEQPEPSVKEHSILVKQKPLVVDFEKTQEPTVVTPELRNFEKIVQ